MNPGTAVRQPPGDTLRTAALPGDPAPGGPATTTAGPTGRAPRRADRRWLRLATPPLLALLVIACTLIVHVIAEPSPANPDYLNPASGAAIGSRTLADQLSANGVRIQVEHSGSAALDLAAAGHTTLFLPAADVLLPATARRLLTLPASVTVVLVRPSAPVRAYAGAARLHARSRWATRPASGCTGTPDLPAGRALVYHDRYLLPENPNSFEIPAFDCFDHAVMGFQPIGATLVFVGADDIFRNDRIGELGNAALAGALLGGHPSLVWLDLHRQEKAPAVKEPSPSPSPTRQPPERTSVPLPGWVKAAVAGLLLAAVLAALAAGRRLGPPVDEPLPVRVRATETALGRGRLYRRARARGVALQALRDNAFQRLRSALQLPAQAPPHAVAAEVAARVGAAPDVVQAILYGPDPQTDEELAAAVADLDALVAAALPAPPVPTGVEEPPDLARTEKEWS